MDNICIQPTKLLNKNTKCGTFLLWYSGSIFKKKNLESPLYPKWGSLSIMWHLKDKYLIKLF